jgi:UDP:flavonoid glycosyltransferase YjiC (YdhE family)
MNNFSSQSRQHVGFFPSFSNLAESGRAVMIAKRYRELGGKVIFFSHGGKFEFLAKNNGFKIIKVKPVISEKIIKEYYKVISFETFRSKTLFNEDWLIESVEEEIAAFKKTGIKLLISTNNITCAISARANKIKYINISPGAGYFALKIPDTLENPFTYFIPQQLKTRVLNWYIIRSKMYLKSLNKVAQKVGIPPFKSILELYDGDITLVTNDLEFINIFVNQQDFPKKNYMGMILIDELFEKEKFKKIDHVVQKHLKKKGKSILLTLGSSGTEELFIKILKTLNKTKYNVIAIYSSILNEYDLPRLNDNILLTKFVSSISKITEIVDLAIINGGQGTVFSTVYAKKPIIGFPMHFEQHINLEKIVGHRTGLMLSRKFFTEKKLLNAINEIFNNYTKFSINAQNLANKLSIPEGDKKIALRILDIVKKELI